MFKNSTAYLLVNFGGPRNISEIEEFLTSLLTDQEVIRTSFPTFIHRLLFTRVAKKRSKKITLDYLAIGGKSPIFEDTESVAKTVGQILETEVLTFHRYLPKTHASFIKKMESLQEVQQIRVVPMFPQFSYATTGSIALWFKRHLTLETVSKLQWIKSYPAHSSYISAMENRLRNFLSEKSLNEKETVLLFSAHGLPKDFISTGDIYEQECRLSFGRLKSCFPEALSRLSYQSQFGKKEWIRPYTSEVCEQIYDWSQGRKNVIIVPLSFTSDHIETLYEIEELYVGRVREKGLNAFRCPALNLGSDWIETLAELFKNHEGLSNQMLIRDRSIVRG